LCIQDLRYVNLKLHEWRRANPSSTLAARVAKHREFAAELAGMTGSERATALASIMAVPTHDAHSEHDEYDDTHTAVYGDQCSGWKYHDGPGK
jgi:hypothetical protein